MQETINEYQESRQTYVDEFLTLKCVGDVLNAVNPIGKKAKKEISETMSIMRLIRRIVLKDPMKYNIIDLCAGNALTSVLAIHLLPLKNATAIDTRPRKRQWDKVRNFHYLNDDIHKLRTWAVKKEDILISVHACCGLADRAVEIYNQSESKHLILMPCCEGVRSKFTFSDTICEGTEKYLLWCLDLAARCEGKVYIHRDHKCLSPKNIVIWANKDDTD